MTRYSAEIRAEKLATLRRSEGYGDDEDAFMAVWALDCVSPAICMNPGCDYATEMEPDQDEGWCEACETNTLMSAAVLAGVI